MREIWVQGHHVDIYRLDGTSHNDNRLLKILPTFLKPRELIWTEGSCSESACINERGIIVSGALTRSEAQLRGLCFLENLRENVSVKGIYDADIIANGRRQRLVARFRSAV